MKILPISIFLLLFSFSFVLAEEPLIEVFENEYIFSAITNPPDAIPTPQNMDVLLDQYDLIAESGNTFLMLPKGTNQEIDRPIVIYDPTTDLCLINPVPAFVCSPNFVVRTTIEANDQLYTENFMWGLNSNLGVQADLAWDYTQGNTDGIVAVLDTGTNLFHADLDNNLWRNVREVSNGIDDDGNGYIDDLFGVNFISAGAPNDDNGHGTHVAGTICAEGNNGFGSVGVNWRCRILTIKFLSAQGGGSIFNAISGIDYLINLKNVFGEKIIAINASWGSSGRSDPLQLAIERARLANILFVAAAGNFAQNTDLFPFYPASFNSDNIISVAAIDFFGKLAFFSNFGVSTVDIAAPGVDIYSTFIPNNSFQSLSGTSMAAPHVTGTAMLMYAYLPMGYSQLKNRILVQARPWNKVAGLVGTGGVLSAFYTIRLDLPPTQPKMCKLTRFSNCKNQCRIDFNTQPARKQCIKQCRKTFHCPKKWMMFYQ